MKLNSASANLQASSLDLYSPVKGASGQIGIPSSFSSFKSKIIFLKRLSFTTLDNDVTNNTVVTVSS